MTVATATALWQPLHNSGGFCLSATEDDVVACLLDRGESQKLSRMLFGIHVKARTFERATTVALSTLRTQLSNARFA